MFGAAAISRTSAGVTTQALAGAPASATLSVVTSLSALRDLEHKWRELEGAANHAPSVFQSFDWVMAWAETYVGQSSSTSLHILAGYDNDELVFLWPLMRTRRFGISVLTWLTDPYGQYGDIMCHKGHCSKQWTSGSITFLRRLKDVDVLRLRHVREDGQMAPHAKAMMHDGRMPEQAPFLDLTQFTSDADYDARYSKEQRKRRKKIRKSLEDMGPVTFRSLPPSSDADTAMREAIAEKNKWLKERKRLNRVLGCPSHLAFLKNLSRRSAGNVAVVVTEQQAGGKPISWEIGFRHRDIHYGYITSHVTKHTDLSPGRLHMDQSQRQAIADGMTRFDLMVPNDNHKQSWSSGHVGTEDYYLPLSLLGHLVGHGYIRSIRPILRSVYYRMTG